LLQTANFGVPAFSGGVLVQLVLSFALQGFSVAFILWLQQGHRFSPIHAGLTLIPFSVGAILSAPNAGNLALKYGRRVLVTGAVLMAAGMVGVAFPALLR
jgi:MFS family permease